MLGNVILSEQGMLEGYGQVPAFGVSSIARVNVKAVFMTGSAKSRDIVRSTAVAAVPPAIGWLK